VARQLRLRDLAGLIVIDFIDMDERKNNAAVEKRLKDRLKTDRARIQVGKISGFGLLEMSRQRLRPGMLESTTQPCAHCHGTGLIRSDDSLALTILRAIEEEGTRKRSREVLVRAPVAVANFLMNAKREHIAMIEARYGMAVRVEADPALISPDFAIEKFKTATRLVVEAVNPVVSVNAQLMAEIDDDDDTDLPPEEDEAESDGEDAAADSADAADEGNGRGKRRRRRRRRGGKDRADDAGNGIENGDEDSTGAAPDAATDMADMADAPAGAAEAATGAETEAEIVPEKPKASRSRSRSRRKPAAAAPEEAVSADEPAAVDAPVEDPAPAKAEIVDLRDTTAPEPAPAEPLGEAQEDPAPEAPKAEAPTEAAPETATELTQPEPADDQPAAPKRRGWWSIG
ncbi:MAG: ribonuclease E/G, partial [Paracoccus sp. (in: a-proteobacteria)]|nr:ribonuclease E/G [Paracoccus sp. (in: a-proteobacteria)]